MSHPVFLCSHCLPRERCSCCVCVRAGGSTGAWAPLSIKGHASPLSYASAIVNYLVWLPMRQRMSSESIGAEIVALAAVLPEVIYCERESRIAGSTSSSFWCTELWRGYTVMCVKPLHFVYDNALLSLLLHRWR